MPLHSLHITESSLFLLGILFFFNSKNKRYQFVILFSLKYKKRYAKAFPELTNNNEIVGGSPYGAGTVAGGDGSRQPSV
jgi:hypothetical protein